MYLSSEPLQLGTLMAEVHSPARGGIACFLGMVRNHNDGRAVQRLEYSAYEPMAEAECASIRGEAESRWDCAVALQHRIGPVLVGEAAVAVVAASAHRDEAFAACRFVIEEIKRRVPIWKHEVYADGSSEWVSGAGGHRGSGAADRELLQRTGNAHRDHP